MLRLRRVQVARGSALGQDYVSDACKTIRTDLGLRNIIKQVGGCGPYGRVAAQIAIAAAAVGTVGPAALPLVSTLGTGAVMDCLCSENTTAPPVFVPPPPPPPPSIWSNPLVWVGVGGLALGLVAMLAIGGGKKGDEIVYA